MAYISPWSTPDETDFGQTRTRFERDYWAPDRDAVLGQLSAYNPTAPFSDRGTFDAEMQRRAQLGATRPSLSGAQLSDLWSLGGGGSERDPNQIYMRAGAYLGSDDWWKRWGAAMGTGSGTAAPTAPTPTSGGTSGGGGLSFGGGDPYHWIRQQAGSLAPTSQSLTQLYDALRAAGVNVSRPTRAGGAFSDDKLVINGQMYDFIRDVGGPQAAWQFGGPISGDGDGGGMAGPPSGGGSRATATSVFSDPATTGWEQLLRQFVDRLNVPQPTWTPAQLELQQTQALDPLERQRTAQKQQVTQRLAQRGITPGSGIFESALRDIDRQFDQLRTTTQANFATQAIGREDQVFQGNEQRAANAVNFMRQIPQLADQRLATAQQTLIPSNPYQLLQLQQQFERDQFAQQQANQYQNQQFLAQLMQYLLPLFQ